MSTDPAITWVHLTTNPGLEDLVEEEVRRRAVVEGIELRRIERRPRGREGHVRVELAGGHDAMRALAMPLRSVHHVLRPLDAFDLDTADPDAAGLAQGADPLARIQERVAAIDAPELDEALAAGHRFAVRCDRRGTHAFGSPDVERVAGAGIRSRRDLPVDLRAPDLRLKVDVVDRHVEIAVQHTDKALSVRRPRPFRPRTSLRASLGFAMCVLTLGFDAAPTRVADPCCGSGTILLEAAALWPGALLRAGDGHPRCVAGVEANLRDAGLWERSELRHEDVRGIGTTWQDLPPVDAIMSNPPWGVRLGGQFDPEGWYRHMLLACAGAVPRGGRIGLLVLKQGALQRALAPVAGLRVLHRRKVEAGGLRPMVVILERAG